MPVHLTPEQESLVRLDEGCFLVLAPPGSGKTEVLVQRIARLARQAELESFGILALSFTKGAAHSMRQRVTEELGDPARRVAFSTYHAFCRELLEAYGHLIGLPRSFALYDTSDDRVSALRQGLEAEGLEQSVSLARPQLVQLLNEISKLKRSLVPPDAVPQQLLDGIPISVQDAYLAYERTLRLHRALDFDSLLVEAHKLLVRDPRVASHYRTIYRYILIDEAQDTSAAQYEILKALCGSAHRNVFMVADPAQSIYGFSGASYRYVEQFVEEFGATRFSLGMNFRCAARILEVASRLMPPEEQLHSGTALNPTAAAARGCVEYASFQNEEGEASAALSWAKTLLRDGMPWECAAAGDDTAVPSEEIAFLARSRNHLTALLLALEQDGMDYHFSTGESGVFDSEEYRFVLQAMKCLANPADVALVRSLTAAAVAVCGDVDDHELSNPNDLQDVFARMSKGTLGTVMGEPLEILTLASGNGLGVTPAMLRLLAWTSSAGGEQAELTTSDRQWLNERWTDYMVRVDDGDRTWQGMLASLVAQPRPEAPGVRVLTVHAAKGLEFRAVWVLGMNEGSFPDFRSAGSGEGLESERRLIYVASTRASRILRFSRAVSRRTRFGLRHQEASRFLKLARLDEAKP